MFVVDTNVLVYAANSDAVEHVRCRSLVEEWREGRERWYTTWGIRYEFLRIVTHPRVFQNPWTADAALGFLAAVSAAPSHGLLVETDRHASVARDVAATVPGLRGNLIHDFHTAVLMREHGISRVVTRDTDFHRFGFVTVIDPLATFDT